MKIKLDCLFTTIADWAYRQEMYYTKKDDIREWNKVTVANDMLWNLCAVLDFSSVKAVKLYRLINRWEERHGWERCFPLGDNYDKIMAYLQNN